MGSSQSDLFMVVEELRMLIVWMRLFDELDFYSCEFRSESGGIAYSNSWVRFDELDFYNCVVPLLASWACSQVFGLI